MKETLSKRQSAVLEVMSKPKTPAELRDQIGLKKTCNLTSAIKTLVASGLIYCLNPIRRMGKLYGVTKKGMRVRKKLDFKEYHQPDDIDWDLYGYVVSGRQRRAVLKAIDERALMPVRFIKKRAQEHNNRISRLNMYDVLREFTKKKIVKEFKINRRVYFVLTAAGQKIRQQLLVK